MEKSGIGDNIAVPHHFHIILTVILAFWMILINAPSMFFLKSAFTFQTGLFAFQCALAGIFATQACNRVHSTIYDRDGRRYFKIGSGSDILAALFAIAAGVMALIYAGNLTLALFGCPGRVLSNCTGTITEAERTLSFYTVTSWDQICFDDFAVTIAWAVIGYATVALDVIVIVFQLSLRETSLNEFGRRATVEELMPRMRQKVVLAAEDGRRMDLVGLTTSFAPTDEDTPVSL